MRESPIGKRYCETEHCFETAGHDGGCKDLNDVPLSPFHARTGLMGATESGQVVTAENIRFLPPGSTVRANDGDWLIHLHDGLWLRIFGCGYCYDREARFHSLLPGYLCHHP
jgi:hypothetical protein